MEKRGAGEREETRRTAGERGERETREKYSDVETGERQEGTGVPGTGVPGTGALESRALDAGASFLEIRMQEGMLSIPGYRSSNNRKHNLLYSNVLCQFTEAAALQLKQQ